MTATMSDSSSDVRAAIDAVLPEVVASAGDTERLRRLPDELVRALRDAGLFRMLVPADFGGLGVEFPTSVEVLRSIARADGAAGWSVMINTESPQLLALLPRSTFEEIYESGPDVTIAGAFAPKGVATRVDGGVTVAGRWQFASACEHSDLLFGNCVVPSDPGVAPVLRCVVAPRAAWKIHDTWDTLGLRGTGSHDIELADVFVPDDHTFDLFGGEPCFDGPEWSAPVLQFGLHIGAVALGIADGAHQAAVEIATGGKSRLYGRTPLKESELFQFRLGRAEADLRAAEAMLYRQVDEFWSAARLGEASMLMAPRILQSVSWVVDTCVRVVDACYHGSGGSAAYRSSPLERRVRDIHTLHQHASIQETVFANSGALLMGVVPDLGL